MRAVAASRVWARTPGMRVLTLLLVLMATACATTVPAWQPAGVHYTPDIEAHGCCTLIAHAGGSIDGNPYSNSRQALLLSIHNGYHLVEMDFERTREGDWFVVHEWPEWASHTGYHGAMPPATSAVVAWQDKYLIRQLEFSIPGTYSTLSLDDLLAILDQHPDVKIITDTKSDANTLALIHALRGRRDFRQFVFQAYSLDGLRKAAAAVPQDQLILTTYLLRDWYAADGFNAAFLAELKKYPHLFALTIPMFTAHDAAKMKRIRDTVSIPILVHGKPKNINSRNLHSQLAKWGVNGVYVD